MTSKLTVAKVGGGELDLTAYSGLKGSPFFDRNDSLVELGHRFADGQASQGTFKLQDPEGEFPAADGSFNLAAHKLVTWSEDASGSELWLSRGRVSTFEAGRGEVAVDNFVEVDATVDDCNIDLGFLAFTEPWVRPQEAGWDRVAALYAYILNGASSTAAKFRDSTDVYFADSHLAPNAARVTMPAKTYAVGTQPGEVVRECADTEGKVWGVVIHHVGGSHLCLRYHAEDNHAVHPSPIKISDNYADWDPEDLATPVFEPHWEMGKASIWDSQELITGLVSTWGPDQTPIFVENSGSVDDYEYWIDTFSDSESTTQEQAEFVANAMLDYRAASNITHRVSIIMLPEQLGLITVGQSLDIKAAAAMAGHFLGAYQLRRVAELTFEPRTDGRYWAHMHLDRVVRRRPARRGNGTGPQPPIPSPAPECEPGGGNGPILYSDNASPGGLSSFFSGDCGGDITHPTALFWSNFGGGDHIPSGGIGGGIVPGETYHFSIETNHSRPAGGSVQVLWLDSGAAVISTVPIGSIAGCTWTTITVDLVAPALADDVVFYQVGSLGTYLYTNVLISGPTADDPFCLPEGTAGESPYYARPDDIKPAEQISIEDTAGDFTATDVEGALAELQADGEAHLADAADAHDASAVSFTPTGTIAATDVQAAIAEVAAEAGVTDHGALTGLTDFDHDQYVRGTHGGREIFQTHGAAGATETIDIANGNYHAVTLDANCTLTFSGSAASRLCSFTLEVTQNGTGGWTLTFPGAVVWPEGTAVQPDPAASSVSFYTFLTRDNGTTWYAFPIGGASSVGELDDLTDVAITSATLDDDLRFDGSLWVNDARKWEAVTGGEDIFVWDGDDLVYDWNA